MVYDMTENQTRPDAGGERGYAIFGKDSTVPSVAAHHEQDFELYTDDGRGNGDHICSSSDIYWIRRIAHALDGTDAREFDYNGNPK